MLSPYRSVVGHSYFLVVPGDYLPLPPGRMWLSIYCHKMEVSWAPLASLISNLDICQGTSLPMPILFKFGSSTSLGWKEWIDEELSYTGFKAAFQQIGVLKAIVSSRCLFNYKDLFNLSHLVHQWCSATHTFFLLRQDHRDLGGYGESTTGAHSQ